MEDARISLSALLASIADEHGYDHSRVKIDPFSTGGANYTSCLFVATITTPGKPDLKLFAKVANLTEDKRQGNKSLDRLYNIERHFYTHLIKDFKKLENDYDVPQEHRLVVPKCYSCDGTYLKETVVLENMAEKGYSMYDRFKSVDWEYASRAIEELAKFHALSFAFSQIYPEKFQQYRELIYDCPFEECVKSAQGWTQLVENAINVVNEINKDRLKKFVAEHVIPSKVAAFKQPLSHPVLRHGDFRSSNLMHMKNENGEMEMIVVDYQTIHTGCGVADLIYFIFTSTDEQFRSRYFHRLVEYYYKQLCEALQVFHLDPHTVYPRGAFDFEFNKMLPYGLHIGLKILQIVTVKVDDAPKLSEKEAPVVTIKTSELFAERLNGIVNDYVKWGII